ncbi:acyltransferase [Paenibacillus xylanexedens]|uniref:acyltransferase family protein n=1 Tax=Paenibacillus xylanexedens TaxID=528191 RepID=UPI001C8ECB5A|nr:acyltransferase [Paenibacillus xylanexedens]MBY0118882.1 acyltransferase [Paenibacillus xylanexedens]
MVRNVGLDFTRSIAILMVLICHGLSFFFMNHNVIGYVYVFGYLGVELFFVLSGFLIGSIMLKDIYHKPKWKNLYEFCAKRWFRTFPAYFVMVIILYFVQKDNFNMQTLFFLQNFRAEHLDFFAVSWSLSIEEWFYVLFSIFFLFLAKIRNSSKKSFILVVVLLLILLSVSRVYYVINYSPLWDFGVRKQIPLRFDSMLVGVLLASIKLYYNKIYEYIPKNRFYLIANLLILFFFGVLYVYNGIVHDTINSSFYGRTFLFVIVSISCAILLVYFEKCKINDLSQGVVKKLITFLSKTSYSVYLVHFPIFMFIAGKYQSNPSILSSLFLMLLSLVVTYAIAITIFLFIETPFMQMRNKLFPNHAKDGVGRY